MRKLLLAILSPLLVWTAVAAEVGKPSPPLNIQGVNSAPLQLSQYKGKVIALALIDTNCPHCQNLTKLLSTIAKDYQGKPVQIVACAFNDHAQDLIAEFKQRFQPSFPVGYCSREEVMTYVQYTAVKPFYVPHMVFLDKRGIVRGDYAGESDFMTKPDVNVRTELDKLLTPATVSASAHKAAPASTATRKE